MPCDECCSVTTHLTEHEKENLRFLWRHLENTQDILRQMVENDCDLKSIRRILDGRLNMAIQILGR